MSQGCFVYVIQAGAHGPVKVGITISPTQRLQGLQNAHYENLALRFSVAFEASEHAFAVEQMAHRTLRTSPDIRRRREWFSCTPEQAITAITQAAETLTLTWKKEPPRKKAQAMDDIDRMLRYKHTPKDDPNYSAEDQRRDLMAFTRARILYDIDAP